MYAEYDELVPELCKLCARRTLFDDFRMPLRKSSPEAGDADEVAGDVMAAVAALAEAADRVDDMECLR